MDKSVVEKCLDFCQALSNNNQLFSFSLTIGSDNFNLDLKELAPLCQEEEVSQSTEKREEKERRKKAGSCKG